MFASRDKRAMLGWAFWWTTFGAESVSIWAIPNWNLAGHMGLWGATTLICAVVCWIGSRNVRVRL